MGRYPPADITPEEFERFVAELFGSATASLHDFRVTPHEKIKGADGTYDFDSTVRYRHMGMDFLVVVEARRHKNSIKWDQIQALLSKAQSVGAHKAVLISTAKFQRGAINFAKVHGVALVTVTEGRFTYETRAATPIPPMSREDAALHFGIPTFVGIYCGPGDSPTSIMLAVVGEDDPERVCELLLAVPAQPAT